MHQSCYYPRTPLSSKCFAFEKSFKGVVFELRSLIYMHTYLLNCMLTYIPVSLVLSNEPCGKFQNDLNDYLIVNSKTWHLKANAHIDKFFFTKILLTVFINFI